jgi:hypothetical protein
MEGAAVASLQLDADELRPIIREIVGQVLAELGNGNGDRLAYLEPEAAQLLGLQPHQLRDLRLAGKIKASKGPRNRALYTRSDLLAYLAKSKDGRSK